MNPAQVNLTARDHREEDGEPPSGARGANPLAGGRLGHMVARNAEVEHRGMPAFGPELPPVNGIDVSEQAGSAALISLDQVAELAEQDVVTQSVERSIRGH